MVFYAQGKVGGVGMERLPDAVEATLDIGDSMIVRANAVMAAADGNLERCRSTLAGADDAIERASHALDAPNPSV